MLGKLGEKLKGSVEKIGDVKNIALEKILEMVDNFNKLLPVFEKIGYRVSEVEIEVGLTPKFILHFEKFAAISDEEIEKVIEENKESSIFVGVVRGLVFAGKLQEEVKIGTLLFSEIEVEAGLTPVVKVKFIK